jgi:cation transporter-like permease
VIPTLIGAILTLVASAPAWADHGAGLGSPGMSPVVSALLWAGAAFLVGMAVVAIVTVLSRRRQSQPDDG